MFSSLTLLRSIALLSLAASASAQYYGPGYYGHRSLAGRIIGGIIVAVVAVFIILLVVGVIYRRRRRTVAVLPTAVGQTSTNWNGPGYGSQQVGYMPYPIASQQQPGWGKNDEYTTQHINGYTAGSPAEGTPQSGGFVVPPNSPPPAHVNSNAHYPWFNATQ
ncbi:hypothetical protein A0H81_06191 [Grifola frondosa]|uniref:Protein RCR2 n=1 Tax=Grifola frondosa TaxID=5627 RepID=A0A1C7MAA5_GRIFR|nr:hypothetical protein A0H81_06191 [Grifola frondosa]